jgi:hypothetical protein
VKAREDFIDPDELQLMDKCNRDWIQAWKDATVCSDVVNADATSRRPSGKKIL